MNKESGKWYDCNDSWVKQISAPDSESSSAYVLFYVMKNGVKVTPWIEAAPLFLTDYEWS